MNILLLTPLYCIEGRPELFHDTNAIHYLVKPWVKEGHRIEVIVTYINYRSQIKRYIDPKQRHYWKNGYKYVVDGISVFLIEEQLIFNKDWFTGVNNCHIVHMVHKHLEKKNFQPDIIINHFPCYSSRYLPMLRYDVPCIAVLHQTDIKKGNYDARHRVLLRKNYQAIYCRSRQIYNTAKTWGLPNLQKELIYSGAPMFEPPKDRNFNFANHMKVLYVGKLIKRKNVDLLIKMLSLFQHMELKIIGIGEEQAYLEQLADELGVRNRVNFVGLKKREEVCLYMKQADIFCMPSVRETFGLVYLEAMSQGCLTIGTRHEGIDGIIVDRKNGFVCDATEDSLKKIFDYIFKCPSNQLRLVSDSAILTSKQFSEDNVSRVYLKLVEQWCVNHNQEQKIY